MSKGSLPVLYSYWRSSCTWRVRIALNWKGIEYKTETVDLVKGEQISSKLLDKSVFGLVPVFALGDTVTIYDSLAIIEYLEEKYPDARTLLPGNAENRATIRGLALQIIANLQPLQNLRVIEHHSANPAERKTWANYWITEMFKKLEQALAKTAGKYAVGDTVSLVDVCIPPQCYNAERFGVDLSAFPTISRLNATLSELPEFVAADCYHQPDYPDREKSN